MSISLIVLEPKSKEYSLVNIPLATDEIFKRIWLPGAEQLSAVWLPLFQSGIDITAHDFKDVSQELIFLREWVVQQTLVADERNLVLSRIDSLLNELVRLDTETKGNITVFVG